MTSPELPVKGVRAYAVYFTVHFAPIFLLALLLQVVTASPVVGQVGMGISWGWALFRLTTRFYRGQSRIPTLPEARLLAMYGGLYSAVLMTVSRGTAVYLLTANTGEGAEVSLALLLAIEFFVSALVNAVTLVVFLLPFFQERGFAAWSARNR